MPVPLNMFTARMTKPGYSILYDCHPHSPPRETYYVVSLTQTDFFLVSKPNTGPWSSKGSCQVTNLSFLLKYIFSTLNKSTTTTDGVVCPT